MVSPTSSFSKDDSGESKGKTDITSLDSFGLGRDFATEFLAQVIRMEKCFSLTLHLDPLMMVVP